MSQKTSAAAASGLASQYQKKTDKEHVLHNPDTYIGAVEIVKSKCFVHHDTEPKIVEKEISLVPGLYKLFDEAVVNSRDHVVRMDQAIQNAQPKAQPVTYIDIGISEDGTITIINDGNGIDVAEHPEYKIWIPELIFGHLRTSTNYNKTEKKIVGGKNGFGFKLVLIWSTWGSIETVDHIRGLKYMQEFKDNLDEISKPKITKCRGKPYTKVMFKPDYARLGISELTPDMRSLFLRRIYDIAAITDKKVKVKYNSTIISVKHFQQYIDLYIGQKGEAKRVYEEGNKRWEYAVALAPNDEFTHVSFVNGIHTARGGKHIDYIMGQIVRKLSAYIKKKKKVDVKASAIKEQLILFLRCDIENPAFDSQTKDYLNTPSNKFGSSCSVSDAFIEKVAKMGVMNVACALTEVKDTHAAKKTDGAKTKKIRGIPKLIDANYAGTSNAHQCTLILCEGDSAKAGIVSGLNKEDRNTIGVYPMKGKLFNVRGETPKKIGENKEIIELKQIIGLETGKEYTEELIRQNLRYGRILFMTDQDLDGSHIKGLGLNLFEAEWRTLSTIPNFFGFMNTPILKARKGTQELQFYNEGEYQKWKKEGNKNGWKIKYYKGLGTSTSKEFKEYFAQKKIVHFLNQGSECVDALDMVFNKKRADDRKIWLADYDREIYLDTEESDVSFKDFINQEMIHFSKYDCDRSIPNLVDGLKISLRKILYAAFKKRLTQEIKVAQFSGYVSEQSCYHHGEASLNGAIVGMAQNFVGANNIHLLEPKGQFGTRLRGGKDSASERYIYTNLNLLTRQIYPEADDAILRYLDDDGTPVEPIHYCPIIPMLLINGSKGIGTGFSTDIMCYNPLQIMEKLMHMLQKKTYEREIEPYYEGFKGTIKKVEVQKYLIKGCYDIRILKNTIQVTELPIGTWTEDYKQYLETLMDIGGKKEKNKKPAIIKDYNDMSTDTTIDISIIFHSGIIQKLAGQKREYGCTELEKVLKLYTTQTTTNMHMFTDEEKLKKYETVEQIIQDYYVVRLKAYSQRKAYQLQHLEAAILLLSNKAKYIQGILEDRIDLRKKKKEEVSVMLQKMGFTMMDEDKDYKYLVRMPMDSVTEENITKLLRDKKEKEEEYKILKTKTEEALWLHELKILKKSYEEYFVMQSEKEHQKINKVKGKLNKSKKKLVLNC